MSERQCNCCGDFKNISHFPKRSHGKYGATCKICSKENGYKRRRDLREKDQQYGRRGYWRDYKKDIVGEPAVSHSMTRRLARRLGHETKHLRKAEKRDRSLCDICPHINTCKSRIAQGLWVLCEAPDVADMHRWETLTGKTKPEDIDTHELEINYTRHGVTINASFDGWAS